MGQVELTGLNVLYQDMQSQVVTILTLTAKSWITIGYAYRFADTPEEKARKLAKKAAVPASKFSSLDILQSLAGTYPLTMDGMAPGLPAGFTSFSAAGIPDSNGKLARACFCFELRMQLLSFPSHCKEESCKRFAGQLVCR